jgi:hypothetical protein
MKKKILRKEFISATLLGTFGSLGLICFLNWIAMATFNEISRYPYLYPFVITAGVVSLLVCIGAFISSIFFVSQTEYKKAYAIAMQLILITFFFIMFFFIWGFSIEIVGRLF